LWFLVYTICFAQNNPAARLLETIPFKQYTGGVIVIEAKLGSNNTVLNFILDTGSGGISLDSATCVELNLNPTPTDTTVNGIAGSHKVSYLFNQKFTTGNLVTDSIHFYVNDYSLLSSSYGDKIDGIVGYSFLSKYILNINFDSSKIKIYSKGKFNYEKGGTLLHPSFSRLVTYPLSLKDKIKIQGDVYLDTGAGLCLLLTENFIEDNHIILSRRKPVITQVQGLGGKKRMRLTVIKRLKFGPYVFRQVPTNLYNDEEGVFSYPTSVGLLGNDIMRRFNITLNYDKEEIHIKPNASFDDHFDYAYTGMSLYNFYDKIFIDDIIKGSPAEKAGLKNGDELIAVGLDFSGSIYNYENLLQRAKEQIKIIIKRDDKMQFVLLRPLSIR
jgi:Aspartyl protease